MRPWNFIVFSIEEGALGRAIEHFDQDHVDRWMRQSGLENTLIDLPHLKLITSVDGERLYLWWKES